MGKYVRRLRRDGAAGCIVFDTVEKAFAATEDDSMVWDTETIYELVEVKRPEPEDHIILWKASTGWTTINTNLTTKSLAEKLCKLWQEHGGTYKAVKVDTSTLTG